MTKTSWVRNRVVRFVMAFVAMLAAGALVMLLLGRDLDADFAVFAVLLFVVAALVALRRESSRWDRMSPDQQAAATTHVFRGNL